MVPDQRFYTKANFYTVNASEDNSRQQITSSIVDKYNQSRATNLTNEYSGFSDIDVDSKKEAGGVVQPAQKSQGSPSILPYYDTDA